MTEPEPTGYENEPEDIYLPLSPERYSTFYDLEMQDRSEDCFYYSDILATHNCRTVLELGCGTGRILGFLNQYARQAVGIDLSRSMLHFASQTAPGMTVEMDMRSLAFKPCFDCVLIPHNTLNLLVTEEDVRCCLLEIKKVLRPGGLLAAHLFAVTDDLSSQAGNRLFQFSLLDRPEGGKLIKETIRTYDSDSNRLLLEERYKVRPFSLPSLNKNYSHQLTLAAYSGSWWLDIIKGSGFSIVEAHADFTKRKFSAGADTTLLVLARFLR